MTLASADTIEEINRLKDVRFTRGMGCLNNSFFIVLNGQLFRQIGYSDDSWIDVHNPNMDVDCDDPPAACPGITLEKYTAAGVCKAEKQLS